MLDSVEPLSFVAGPIGPVHFSVAVPLVLLVAPTVNVARFPSKSAQTRLLVICVLALILVTVLGFLSLTPLAFAVLHTVSELPHIDRSVFPFVLTETLRFAINILSCVDVTVGEHVRSLSMLQAELPFAFVSISIFPLVDSIPVCFTLGPLAYVRVTKYTFPNALPFLETSFPLAFVELAVQPVVDSLAVRLIIFEFSIVLISIAVAFHAAAVAIVA